MVGYPTIPDIQRNPNYNVSLHKCRIVTKDLYLFKVKLSVDSEKKKYIGKYYDYFMIVSW